MSGKDKKLEKRFITLYRLKVQRDLDAMGYPGGEEDETAVRAPIIDAGAEVCSRMQDHGGKKRDVVPGQ